MSTQGGAPILAAGRPVRASASRPRVADESPSGQAALLCADSVTTPRRYAPTNSLKWVVAEPCPCESKCADIRNKAHEALETNDIGEIAWRYLQTRRGQQVTRKEAITYGLTTLLAPVMALHMLPNAVNSVNYKATKRECKAYLTEHLGPQTFAQIQQLKKFKSESVQKLATILEEQGIDAACLEPRIHRLKEPKSCEDRVCASEAMTLGDKVF